MADNFINKINVNNEDYFLSPTFTSQIKNYVLAAPSNANGVPSFRKLVAADIPDLSYVPTKTGPNDVNTMYNTGIYNITSGQAENAPKGYGFGQLLVMSYRKHTGNTTTDWASQIYLHNGVGTETGNATGPGNVLYYRTSNAASSNNWFSWQKAVHTDSAYTKVGNTNQPVYIAEDGTATAITAVGAAYGGTGKTTLNDSANALINALSEGTNPATGNDYLVAQFAGGGTTTTTYHRRKVSNVVNATVVKAALGTVSTTAKKFLKDTGSWEQVAFSDLTTHPTTIGGYGITDAKIASGTITLGSNTISPVTAVTWDSTNKKLTRTINGTAADVVTADTLRAALGLSNALHFIGVTSTTLADGSTTSTLTAKSTGSLTKTTGFVDGDVVMDGDQLREYVWSGSAWRLLGITTSTTYSKTTSGNTFISSISQGTDGKVTADSRELDTSGTWSGTATSATTTADTSNTLYVVGVTSSATTTLKRDTSVTVKGGAVSATTYNGLTLTAASTGFTIAGGTTSKTLTVSDTLTLKTGGANHVAYYSAAGTISGHSQAHFSDTWSSSTKNGKNELVLGNSVASTSNGSAYGQLALYSENTAGTYLKSESGTSWETATLQAKTGTIALMSDVIESKVEIIRLA